MESIKSQDLNLDIAALEEFATHLETNEELKAASFASTVAHNSNNDSAAGGSGSY
jgi:hypothetical protein